MKDNSVLTVAQFIERYRMGSPFDLDNEKAYQAWRDYKLQDYPQTIEEMTVEVNNPFALTSAEYEAIHKRLVKTNMAIYVTGCGDNADKDIPAKIGERFGLSELDDNMGADEGVTSLQVVSSQWRGTYIPYTNKPIHWHTDGYYNAEDRQIRALMLHCVRPAAKGGEIALLDHEIAYIHLRDTNPEYIHALMSADVMTIPANIVDGRELRPDRTGPVFSVMPDGNLHMRYTARTRSIVWKDDMITASVRDDLTAFLASDSPYIYRGTLQSGQGLICNNVLHDRSGFEDEEGNARLLYRLRYYQRIAST